MKDEEYVLRQDNRDRAVTARSARNKRTHCGRGGRVKLPSDYMTKKEIKAMSGEVKTYRLNEPMKWDEWKKMPDDIRCIYINLIREKFNAPDIAIAEMMGVHKITLAREIAKLGIGRGNHHSRKWDKEGFLAWWHGIPVQAEETPEIVAEEIHAEIPVGPVEEVVEIPVPETASCMPNGGQLRFFGNVDEIANTLRVLLCGAKVRMCIEWEVEEDDG